MIQKYIAALMVLAACFWAAGSPQTAYSLTIEQGDSPVNTLTAQAARQTLPVSVAVEVPAAQPMVGDEVQIAVTVTARADVTLNPAAYPKTLGDWDVLKVQSSGVQLVDGLRKRVDVLTLQTFLPGEIELPALVQKYKTTDNQPGEFRSAAQKITVLPVPTKKSDKPGSIRGLKKPQGMFSWWWAGMIAGALLVLAGILLWVLRRANHPILAAQPKTPPRPAHLVALERLESLKRSALISQGQFKVYYIELSDILRRYIEGRYLIAAMDMTTHELMRNLKAHFKTQEAAAVRNVLNRSDMVKFAKLAPTEKEADEDWQAAQGMVLRTAEPDSVVAGTGEEDAAQ